MNRATLLNYAKATLILAGGVCFALAVANLSVETFTPGFLLIVVFSMLVAPRMSVALPRSRFALSFSDAAVFLVFLLYGGPAAVIVAGLESAANCLYLRSKGVVFGKLMIPTNIAIGCIVFGLTYLIWSNIPSVHFLATAPGTTQRLITMLGALALIQFAVASALAAIFVWVKDGASPLDTWRRDCFATSMTQIVGAGIAGMASKIINFGDLATALIAFAASAIAYLSYRQSISEVNEAMTQAEAAEREKADAERERRREAEKYASELAFSLQKEERANEALRKSEKDLQHAALYDSLTDLPNRKHFGDMLQRLIADYKENPSHAFQVLFLDIRGFKNINDSLGHTVGDKVLMIAARRFIRMLNSDDLVARIGGDEFAIILNGLATGGKAQKVARRIISSIAQPFSLTGNRINISVNVGIAPCDAEYNTPEEILRDADIAMHYAKEKDSGVAVFTKDLRVRFLERVRFEADLQNAVGRKELSMSYQPLIKLDGGELLGFEALLRWQHPEFGQVPPNKFIPIAEESGLIIPITTWILEETCRQISAWHKIPGCEDLIVSVNISGRHLSNDDLIDDVENALDAAKLDPRFLKLEITESAAMESAEQTITVLNRVKQIGVQLSIDDFGTGYSSLSYLHRLPFDTLKIDRSFVGSVGARGENSEILQTIISLAKNLKKKVLAEGIETDAQLHLLQDLGCDYGQGYLFAKPLTKDNAEKALYEHRRWIPPHILDISDESLRVPEHSLPVF